MSWSFHNHALFAHFAQHSDHELPAMFHERDAPKILRSHKCSAEQFGSLLLEVYNLAGDRTIKVVRVTHPPQPLVKP